MFKNPFSFEGRIRRTEYGLSIIMTPAVAIIIVLIIGGTGMAKEMLYFFLIPIYWFAFAQNTKRCHDRGNSGWYQIIPFYGLWMLFADSDNGSNKYGDNPKGIGNQEESTGI